MDELQVTVQQTPGVITWNFEDLKTALRGEMENYKSLVYTDDAIPEAKKDVAQLRKLKKMVEDRRIEIKNKCLEPYEIIEAQAKELVTLIDEPIDLINQQVKDYEKEQKEKRKAVIDAYMKDKFSDLPDEIEIIAKAKVYDVRWLNATFKVKDWKAAVDSCAEEVKRCVDLLNNTEDEFREQAFHTYCQNLDFSAAVARVQELKEQKERILAAERRRKEEAERRAQEEAERKTREEAELRSMEAERRAAEEELRRRAEAVRQVKEEDECHVTVGDTIESIQREAFEKTVIEPVNREPAGDGSILLRIYGTPEDQEKIKGYIGFLGVRYDML